MPTGQVSQVQTAADRRPVTGEKQSTVIQTGHAHLQNGPVLQQRLMTGDRVRLNELKQGTALLQLISTIRVRLSVLKMFKDKY